MAVNKIRTVFYRAFPQGSLPAYTIFPRSGPNYLPNFDVFREAVLLISELLLQVRAAQLTDLVYKSGQAGVTKASVCVVFDNTDKTQTPVGFEHYDEITVTRQVGLVSNVWLVLKAASQKTVSVNVELMNVSLGRARAY